MFFTRLLETREPAGELLVCEVNKSASVDFVDAGGNGTLEVRFKPSKIDSPKTLTVLVGAEDGPNSREEMLPPGEYLLRERLLPVTVPKGLALQAGEVLRIPYHITGRTIFDHNIDLRGAWEVLASSGPISPLTEEELVRFWPGASGGAVREHKGYYGRKEGDG